MKTIYRIIFAGGIFMGAYLARAEKTPAGQIKLMKGGVFIVDTASKVVADPEGKRGRSTKMGSPFYVGETIQTKADGRVKLEFIEGKNEVVLGPDTALTIERASTRADAKKGTDLNLARGEVRSDVHQKYSGKDGNSFQVKTPNAVAGVRGTIVYARYDAKNAKSDFACLKGSFDVSSSGGAASVKVDAGMSTSASKNSTVESPKPLTSNPEMMKAAESLGNESAKNDKKSDADGRSPASAAPEAKKDSTVTADAKDAGGATGKDKAPAKDSGSAPLGREPVAETSSKDSSGRSPASIGTVDTAAANRSGGGPALMGAAGAESGPAMKVGDMGSPFQNLGDLLNNKIAGAQDIGQQQNSLNNTRGRVIIRLQ